MIIRAHWIFWDHLFYVIICLTDYLYVCVLQIMDIVTCHLACHKTIYNHSGCHNSMHSYCVRSFFLISILYNMCICTCVENNIYCQQWSGMSQSRHNHHSCNESSYSNAVQFLFLYLVLTLGVEKYINGN